MNTTLARVIVAVVILGLVVGVPTLIWLWDRRTGGLRAASWETAGERPTPAADDASVTARERPTPAADGASATADGASVAAAGDAAAHRPPARVASGTPAHQQTPG